MAESRKVPSGLVALKKIVEGTSGSTGQTFFRALVKNLSEILDVYGVWVTEYLPEAHQLSALAFYLDGKFVDKYEYQVTGTPCEPVLNKNGLCHIPDRVVELFPNDPDLKPNNAVSYMGLALRDEENKVLGHLAMLDNKPMDEVPEAFAIFRIFASRAEAELRRRTADLRLNEQQQRLDRLINGTSEMIVEFDRQLQIVQVNNALVQNVNANKEGYRNQNLFKFFDNQSQSRLKGAINNLMSQSSKSTYWINETLNLLCKQKEPLPVEATLSSYRHQQIQYFALFMRNIDEKLANRRLIQKLDKETLLLREKLSDYQFSDIIGNSEPIQTVKRQISMVAPTDSTVLVLGETGTGKELIADAIHKASNRKDESFVTVNCAALPSELIESELFGHVKGAFTNASTSRTGRFLLADKGTIFLDEIGELPLELQPKLLRVLQEGTFEQVGSSKTQHVNVRIIAATNRDLKEEIRKGKFREDLYYRLNVFPMNIPSLKERGDDVILLARHFMQKYSKKYNLSLQELGPYNEKCLRNYTWPGNIRELQNIIERALIISQDGTFDLEKLLTVNDQKESGTKPEADPSEIYTEAEWRELEKQNIYRALESTNWKISGKDGAARLLGIPSTTLNSRILKYNLNPRTVE